MIQLKFHSRHQVGRDRKYITKLDLHILTSTTVVIIFTSGLRYIYLMTKGVGNELRLDLEKSTGEKGHAVYQSFSLSERPIYVLNIGTYSGTAGNILLSRF